MITKGYIAGKVSEDSNKFLVRLPIYETVEDEGEEILYEATVSYVPGNLHTYNEGDAVFVSFEDNDPEKLVIIGSLFLGDEAEKATAAQIADTLNVASTTQLSKDTYIGGVRVDKLFASQADLEHIEQELSKQITYRVLDIE